MSFFGQKLVENWFFCQKNLNPDFAATTVTKIQANQTMHCLFKKKKIGLTTCHPSQLQQKNRSLYAGPNKIS
jgi:hypothetical protein